MKLEFKAEHGMVRMTERSMRPFGTKQARTIRKRLREVDYILENKLVGQIAPYVMEKIACLDELALREHKDYRKLHKEWLVVHQERIELWMEDRRKKKAEIDRQIQELIDKKNNI